MLTIHSFLQNIYQFVKSLILNIPKRAYRSASIISIGSVVLSVVFLNTNNYAGGGKSAVTALEVQDEDEIEPTEVIGENDEIIAEIQVGLTDELQEARVIIGDQLVETVQESIQEETAAIEALDTAIVMAHGRQLATPVISYTEADYEVMLRIVEAEAGDCGAIGKILVANVIINRVISERFPDTITEVVYQRSKSTAQFSPVSNGSINRVTVTQETIDSVEKALYGEDYSEGALFFMMRSASTAKNISWFDRDLKWLFKEGPHEFFTYK